MVLRLFILLLLIQLSACSENLQPQYNNQDTNKNQGKIPDKNNDISDSKRNTATEEDPSSEERKPNNASENKALKDLADFKKELEDQQRKSKAQLEEQLAQSANAIGDLEALVEKQIQQKQKALDEKNKRKDEDLRKIKQAEEERKRLEDNEIDRLKANAEQLELYRKQLAREDEARMQRQAHEVAAQAKSMFKDIKNMKVDGALVKAKETQALSGIYGITWDALFAKTEDEFLVYWVNLNENTRIHLLRNFEHLQNAYEQYGKAINARVAHLENTAKKVKDLIDLVAKAKGTGFSFKNQALLEQFTKMQSWINDPSSNSSYATLKNEAGKYVFSRIPFSLEMIEEIAKIVRED